MTWKLWLHGLGAVAVGGGLTGGTQALSGTGSLKTTGLTAAAGAIVAVLGYFLQSPLFKGITPPPAPPANK